MLTEKQRDILHTEFPDIKAEQIDALAAYCDLLRDWNQRINLVSRKDIDFLWENHILPSILPLTIAAIPTGIRVLDIGSGGGLPALPLKILRPDLQIVMIDSIRKKYYFLQEAIRALQLHGITAMNHRVEALHDQEELLEAFDLVTARAVAPLERLIKYGSPFLKTPRRFLLWKGSSDIPDLEARAARKDFQYTIHRLPASKHSLSPKLAELCWFEIRFS